MSSSSPSTPSQLQDGSINPQDQKPRTRIAVLSERVGQLSLSKHSCENKATKDRIDTLISGLRLEEEVGAEGDKGRTEKGPVERGRAGDQRRDREINEPMRVAKSDKAGRSLNKAESKVEREERKRSRHTRKRDGVVHPKEHRPKTGHTQDGRRHTAESPKLSDLGPHIPTAFVKRDTMEKKSRHHGHRHQGPSPHLASPGSHISTLQRRQQDAKPKQYAHRDDGGEPHAAPSPSTRARTEYATAFPDGHETIFTPGDGLLCGFAATTLTMGAMHHTLPQPTIAALQAILNSSEYIQHATGFNLTNHNNFYVDQIAAVLYFWGRDRGLNLQVGYVPDGQEPQLVPHPNLDKTIVVWIHHLPADLKKHRDAVGHFEGMRQRGSGRKKGIHRRAWVKRLDQKILSMT